jgi:hypothetical protein
MARHAWLRRPEIRSPNAFWSSSEVFCGGLKRDRTVHHDDRSVCGTKGEG